MACAQQVRQSQLQFPSVTVVLTFPNEAQLLSNEVVSEQQSLLVVRRLLAIAVSGITYLRGIFPGRAYGSKYVEDQQVMILKGERDCPGAYQILKWMEGCFDAIDKKYLRSVIMSIYTDPENPQKVTEYYQFKIQYTAGGAQMDFESNNNQKISKMSCGNTKQASILLVRKLYTLMQNLGPLPDSVCLNMKLAYYDDVTPQDYQPPGFKEADGGIMEFEQEPVKLTMGEVATPFHCLKFDMTTEKQRLEQVEDDVPAKEKWVVRIEEDSIITQSHDPEEVEEPHNEDKALDKSEIQASCHEEIQTCEVVTKMDSLVKKTSEVMVDLKRTRSGRIIRSTVETVTVNSQQPTTPKEQMVSHYDIHSSQNSSAAPTAKKRRKFSEPKEHY